MRGVPQTPEQVRALAVQFESILLAQMLTSMRDSMFDSGEESSGFGAGPLGDSLFQEFSIALSRAGGIGLGQSLMAPLEAAAGLAAAGPTFQTAGTQIARQCRDQRSGGCRGARASVSADVRRMAGVAIQFPAPRSFTTGSISRCRSVTMCRLRERAK